MPDRIRAPLNAQINPDTPYDRALEAGQNPLLAVDTPAGVVDPLAARVVAPAPGSVEAPPRAPAEEAAPAALADPLREQRSGLAQAVVEYDAQGRPQISRAKLRQVADAAGVRDRSWQGQEEWLQSLAQDLAQSSPSPVGVEDVYQSLVPLFEGAGYRFGDNPGFWGTAARIAGNLPAALAGGVDQLADTLTGVYDTSMAVTEGALRSVGLGDALDRLDENELVQTLDRVNPLRITREGLEQAGDLAEAGKEMLTTEGQANTQKRVQELLNEERYQDLLSFLTTTGPGVAFSGTTVAESLVPFSILSRARAAITAGQAVSPARAAGEISAVLGAGQTAAGLAEDGELTGGEALGSLTVGGATGVLTGLAGRIGTTPETLIQRIISGAPAEAVATPASLRTFIGGTLRSMGAEGGSEAAQEAVQALVETGYDSNGRWSVDRVDPAAVAGAATLGGGIGLVGGTASGVAESGVDTARQRLAQRAAQRDADELAATQETLQETADQVAQEAPPAPYTNTLMPGDLQTERARQFGAAIANDVQAAGEDIQARRDAAVARVDAALDDLAVLAEGEQGDARTAIENDMTVLRSWRDANEQAYAAGVAAAQVGPQLPEGGRPADPLSDAEIQRQEEAMWREQERILAEEEAAWTQRAREIRSREGTQEALRRVQEVRQRRLAAEARANELEAANRLLPSPGQTTAQPAPLPVDRRGRVRQATGEPISEFVSPQVRQAQTPRIASPQDLAAETDNPLMALPAPGPAGAVSQRPLRTDRRGRVRAPTGERISEFVSPQVRQAQTPRITPPQDLAAEPDNPLMALPAPGPAGAVSQRPLRVDRRGRVRAPTGERISEFEAPGVAQARAQFQQAVGSSDPLAEPVQGVGEQQGNIDQDVETEVSRSGLYMPQIIQAAADNPQGLPPAALFAEDSWQTKAAKQIAGYNRNIYQAEPDPRLRATMIENLNDIIQNGRRPNGDWRAPDTMSFQDAQRAADILQAMRLAEEIAPVDEVNTVDYQGNTEVPSGELPAGNDATLQHHVAFGEILEQGDVAGALRWARDNLKGSRNQLLGPLARLAGDPNVALRVQLEPSSRVVRGRSVEAWYDPETATIHITRRSAGTPYYAIHETAHAITEWAIQNPEALTDSQRQALDVLQAIYEDAKSNGLLPEYALSNLSEFVAEAWSNPDVQIRMNYRPQVEGVSRLHNAYKAFVNTLRRILGISSKAQSALESVAVASYAISSAGQRSAETTVDPSVEVVYSAVHAYRRDPDTQKKTIVAIITPTETGANLRTLDGAVNQNFPDLKSAATAAENLGPGVRVSELTTAENLRNENAQSVFNDAALSPLARAVKAFIRRTVGYVNEGMATAMADTLTGAMRAIKTRQTDRYAYLQELQRQTGVPVYDEALVNQSRQRARYTREAGDIASTVSATARALGGINSTVQRFGDYLYALHVEERNQARAVGDKDTTAFSFKHNGRTITGDGTVAGARRVVQQFQATLSAKERQVFPALERQWRAIMDEMLDAEYELGYYDADTYYKLGGRREDGTRAPGAYQHYVPLLTESTTGRAIPGAAVTGRSTTAANPFESMYRQLTQRAMRLANLQTRKDLLLLLQEHPIPDLATIQATKVRFDEDGNPEVISDSQSVRNNSIYVPHQGSWMRITVKPETSQGRALLDAFNNNPYDEETNRYLRAASSVTRTLASLNTTFNPGFALKALAWDAQATLFNFQGAFDRDLSVFDAYKLSLQAFRNAGQALATSGLAVTTGESRSRVLPWSPSEDPTLALFGELGGGVNVGGFADGAELSAKLRRAASRSRAEWGSNFLLAGRATGAQVLGGIGHVLHSGSQALRYGAFKAYIEHRAGRTFGPGDGDALAAWAVTPEGREAVRKAVVGSKQLGGNFEVRGTGRVLPSLFAFWNAAMQGTRMFASMASTPQGVVGFAALGALGMFGALAAMSDPDDVDDDGGSKYARSTDRLQALLVERDSGFQVPIAYEARLPLVLGQGMAMLITGKGSPSQVFTDSVAAVKDMLLPLSAPGGVDSTFNFAYAITPTAAQATLVPLFGYDAFGRTLDPEYVRGPDGKTIPAPANFELQNARTIGWVADTTEYLWTVSGGAIDLSPSRLSEMVNQVGGGALRFMSKSLSVPDPDVGFSDVPVIQEATRAFRHRDNPFALRQEYEELQQNYQASMRQIMRQSGSDNGGFDMLRANRAQVQARKIDSQLQRQLRNVKVEGFTRAAIYQLRDDAREANDEAEIVRAENLLRKYYDVQHQLYGRAKAALDELEDQYAGDN